MSVDPCAPPPDLGALDLDLPLLGLLFRGQRNSSRKTNMLIFLTPHIVDAPEDLEEVYRIKWAQRQEYIKRFYGKGRDRAANEMKKLLSSCFARDGYAAVVEILCAALQDNGWGAQLADAYIDENGNKARRPSLLGHFFLAIDVSAFTVSRFASLEFFWAWLIWVAGPPSAPGAWS